MPRFARIARSSAVLLLAGLAAAVHSKDLTIGFDGFVDLFINPTFQGVTFSGATVLACGGTLNCTGFPPASGRNVIYDSSAPIVVTFAPTLGNVSKVSAKVTGNTNITMTALDAQGQSLGSAQTGGANYVGSGGPPPNRLLALEAPPGKVITKVTFRDSGNTFTIDDFSLTYEPAVFLIDPGHGIVKDKDGIPRFQRPASPTYSLREDLLTLDIGRAAVKRLAAKNLAVYTTRDDSSAPYKGTCGEYSTASDSIPTQCAKDLWHRTDERDKLELKGRDVIFVSIHTNGGDARSLRGRTQTFYCSNRAKALAEALLQAIWLIAPPNTSLFTGGYKDCDDKHVIKDVLKDRAVGDGVSSALAEVLYHNNAEDEEILVNGPKLTALGDAIADAMVTFQATKNGGK